MSAEVIEFGVPAVDDELFDTWKRRVARLTDDIRAWSVEQGWPVTEDSVVVHEEPPGEYRLQGLRIRLPNAEVRVQPVARLVMGGEGRVDIYSYPSMERVM